MSAPSTSQGSAEVLSHIFRIGSELKSEFQQILAALAQDQLSRPQQLAHQLKLNKDLTSRLLMAVTSQDPLSVAYALPGPVPLKLFLDASERHGVPRSHIETARSAVGSFEAFLNEHFEDRGELDALLGTALRDARRRSESAAKQAMFRGAVGLKGVSCEATVISFLVHPSATKAGWCDTALLGGLMGLRRLRPNVVVEYTSEIVEYTNAPRGESVRSPIDLDSTPDSPLSDEPLLRQFCHPQHLPIESRRDGGRVTYQLTGDGVGRLSAINLLLAEFYSHNHPMAPVAGHPTKRWMYATIEQPSRRLVFDLFIHREVWVGRQPRLEIYDTLINGLSDPCKPEHAPRKLDLAESIEDLGTGISCARHKVLPRYTDALSHVAASRSWNPMDFRALRCEIAYPVYGSQVCMVIEIAGG